MYLDRDMNKYYEYVFTASPKDTEQAHWQSLQVSEFNILTGRGST